MPFEGRRRATRLAVRRPAHEPVGGRPFAYPVATVDLELRAGDPRVLVVASRSRARGPHRLISPSLACATPIVAREGLGPPGLGPSPARAAADLRGGPECPRKALAETGSPAPARHQPLPSTALSRCQKERCVVGPIERTRSVRLRVALPIVLRYGAAALTLAKACGGRRGDGRARAATRFVAVVPPPASGRRSGSATGRTEPRSTRGIERPDRGGAFSGSLTRISRRRRSNLFGAVLIGEAQAVPNQADTTPASAPRGSGHEGRRPKGARTVPPSPGILAFGPVPVLLVEPRSGDTAGAAGSADGAIRAPSCVGRPCPSFDRPRRFRPPPRVRARLRQEPREGTVAGRRPFAPSDRSGAPEGPLDSRARARAEPSTRCAVARPTRADRGGPARGPGRLRAATADARHLRVLPDIGRRPDGREGPSETGRCRESSRGTGRAPCRDPRWSGRSALEGQGRPRWVGGGPSPGLRSGERRSRRADGARGRSS